MKLLRISDSSGQFLNLEGGYSPIDKLSKEDLLRLVDKALQDDEAMFDAYDEQTLKNQAHQVIYKSVYVKLKALRERRKEFMDEAARLYLEASEKYREQGT